MSDLAFRNLADLCMSDFCTPLTRQAWEIIASDPAEFLRRLQGWPLFIADRSHGVKVNLCKSKPKPKPKNVYTFRVNHLTS